MDEEAPWAFKTDIWESNWPRVDMSESDNDIVITAELPGVDKDSVDISVTDNRITISGEKESNKIWRKGVIIKQNVPTVLSKEVFIFPARWNQIKSMHILQMVC